METASFGMSEAGEEEDEGGEERETASFDMVWSWNWSMKQVKERERLGDVEGTLDIDVDGDWRATCAMVTRAKGWWVGGLRNGGEAFVVRNRKDLRTCNW